MIEIPGSRIMLWDQKITDSLAYLEKCAAEKEVENIILGTVIK